MAKTSEQKLVFDAIEYAEAIAGKDSTAFIRHLRAKFFADQGPRPQARGMRLTSARSTTVNPDLRIFEDPRFVQNARAVAQLAKTGMRIIGGTTVKRPDFPDCVAVGDNRRWFCSGTLIASNAVITAGHCNCEVKRVFFGNNVRVPGKIVRVSKVIPHPRYLSSKNENDLMMLILERDVTNIDPRIIARKSVIEAAKDGRVVGFGNTNPVGSRGFGIKRVADVPIVSHCCNGTVKRKSDQAYYGCKRGYELIAGKPLLERDTCTGDSGGPLYVSNRNGDWFLAGATSRSSWTAGTPPENDCGDGGVYVRIDQYRDWIESIPDIRL